MKTLAIIGTAGRGSDLLKLNLDKYMVMIDACNKVIEHEKVDRLVSGGAAWADHCALEFDLPLSLWLPGLHNDLNVALKYHQTFSKAISRDTWTEVVTHNHFTHGGFKDRNTKVANEADVFLAMTFGDGPRVKDGGTADTVRKMLDRGVKGYHLDLNTEEIYEAEL